MDYSFVFNENTSTILQFFAVPLEITGVALALIDVRLPKTARKIKELFEEHWLLSSLGFTTGFNVLFVIYIVILFFGALFQNLMGTIMTIAWVIFLLFGFIVLLLDIFLSSDIFESLSKNKPLGTFGIFLASIGIILEFYQVITIILNPPVNLCS
ncbi:MAG: hypothetical protein AAGA64_18350 [Bacteroidota bacterium]